MKDKYTLSDKYLKLNRRINEILRYDMEAGMYSKDGITTCYKNKALLSVSRVLQPFNEIIFSQIPKDVLDVAKIEGKELMENLYQMSHRRLKTIENLNFISEKCKTMFVSVVQCLIDNKLRIRSCEKHVHNDYWHGYVDLVVRDHMSRNAIVEIKTRSNDKITNKDKLQVMIYSLIMGVWGINCYVLILNKKTMKCKLHKLNLVKERHLISDMNKFLVSMGMDKYVLDFSNTWKLVKQEALEK